MGIYYTSYLWYTQAPHFLQCIAVVYIIYITWAGGICLMCMHKPEGMQCLRASADITGKSRPHMLHMFCNTSSTLKNLLNLPFTVLPFI